MIYKKLIKKINFVLIFGILILNINLSSGANVGISPAQINFQNVLRGGYAEKFTTITIDSTEPVKINVSVRGEIENWIYFEEKEFNVSKGNPHHLKIIIRPPKDVPNGNYSGFVRIRTYSDPKTFEGYATGIINAAIDLSVNVEITDIEILSCTATQFNVESAEKGDPIIFNAEIFNNGNIKLKPKFKIEIWDENQIEIIKEIEFTGEEISPTTSKKININVDSSNMKIGQYWAEISSVDCYASQTLTFDILEEGALKASGILTKIITVPWVEKGDTTLIKAYFENNGEKTVNAVFKGEITLDGKIVQILQSESAYVGIGDTNEFDFYFTPNKQGKYIVSGRVFYSGKRTFEKSAIINVIEKGFKISNLKIPLIYLSLIIAIAFLIYKIRKERKKIERKIKRLKNE